MIKKRMKIVQESVLFERRVCGLVSWYLVVLGRSEMRQGSQRVSVLFVLSCSEMGWVQGGYRWQTKFI